jgi:hypothetical protein
MTGPTSFLLAYGIITTLATTILAILYSHCGSSETKEIVKGDANSVTKTEFGLINFDNGEDIFTDNLTNCDCGFFQLEWTILEMIVMSVLGLAIICGLIKGFLHLKNLVHKRSEKLKERKRNLEVEMRQRIKDELSSKSADFDLPRYDAIATESVEPEAARKVEQISYP